MGDTCQTCRFFLAVVHHGACTVDTPRPYPGPNLPYSPWPVVHKTDWCDRFELTKTGQKVAPSHRMETGQ